MSVKEKLLLAISQLTNNTSSVSGSKESSHKVLVEELQKLKTNNEELLEVSRMMTPINPRLAHHCASLVQRNSRSIASIKKEMSYDSQSLLGKREGP